MNKKNIRTIVLLVGGYVVCQAIADVSATKIVQIGSIVLPAGTFIFTITFTLRDMLHKRLGKQWAKAAIWSAGAFNLVMAAYFALMALLPSPGWFALGEAWNAIFAIVPAITIASITAEVVSELLDTEVYHLWKKKLPKAPQWSRVVVSNAVSLPVDSLIFALLAFVVLPPLFGAEALPLSAALMLVVGQIVWKAIVTVISIPGIYMVKDEQIKFASLE